MAANPGSVMGLRELAKLLAALLGAEAARRAAQSIPDSRTREADCSEASDDTACNQCELEEGFIAPSRPKRDIHATNFINFEYQLYVANLHANPERFGYTVGYDGTLLSGFDMSIAAKIGRFLRGEEQLGLEDLNTLEWRMGDVEFDGFWREKCTVVEAKGNYMGFFDDNGDPRWSFVERMTRKDWGNQMLRQREVVDKAAPRGKLEWHFMQRGVYLIAVEILDPSVCRYTPYIPVQG